MTGTGVMVPEESPGFDRLALPLAMAMFVLVVICR